MIWILLSAISRPSQSIAAGAASLSDSSIRSRPSSSSSSSSAEGSGASSPSTSAAASRLPPGGETRRRASPAVGPGVAQRGGRTLLAHDEVPEDLLGDEETALELGDDGRRRLEHDDGVGAFAMAIARVGEPPAAPRGDLDDLAAVGGDLAGGAIDDRGD